MARDRLGPNRDQLVVARLTGIARRHARWGSLDEERQAAGATELRQAAAGRGDLLAEVAGVALGTSEGKGEEYRAQSQAVAGLCRAAGADEDLILGWIEEGRRRAEAARLPPFSRPGRAPPRP